MYIVRLFIYKKLAYKKKICKRKLGCNFDTGLIMRTIPDVSLIETFLNLYFGRINAKQIVGILTF
jgi:hypothetical protein